MQNFSYRWFMCDAEQTIGIFFRGNEELMSKKKERILFICYLLLFLGTAMVIALMQPHADTPPWYGNPPDEPFRYKVVQFIYKYGKLPNGYDPEIRIPGYGISYGFYTLLPYIVQGFFLRFVSLFSKDALVLLYAARFVNIIFGLCMAVVVYFLAGRLFKDSRFKWLFCFAVMFLPQNLFLHTYVNTDSMSMLSTAIIMYALVAAYQDSFTWKNSTILAIGISICAQSYFNAYGFILCSIFLYVGFYIKKNAATGKIQIDWKEFWLKGGYIAGLVLLLAGWCFVRNAILYDGDFLGMESLKKCAALYGDPAVQPYDKTYSARGLSVFTMLKEQGFFNGLYLSFIATYGSMAITGNIWMYRFYKVFLAVGMIAFLLIRNKEEKKENRGKRIFFRINMLLCILIPLFLCIRYAYTMDYQHQGRYVMPALIPIMLWTVEGLRKLHSLSFLPAKWKKAEKMLKRIADAALYLSMAVIILFLLHMVFFCAVPVYRAIGYVL